MSGSHGRADRIAIESGQACGSGRGPLPARKARTCAVAMAPQLISPSTLLRSGGTSEPWCHEPVARDVLIDCGSVMPEDQSPRLPAHPRGGRWVRAPITLYDMRSRRCGQPHAAAGPNDSCRTADSPTCEEKSRVAKAEPRATACPIRQGIEMRRPAWDAGRAASRSPSPGRLAANRRAHPHGWRGLGRQPVPRRRLGSTLGGRRRARNAKTPACLYRRQLRRSVLFPNGALWPTSQRIATTTQQPWIVDNPRSLRIHTS